ncbi:MAG TPA: AI-2E family transporter [Bryobacteraceae bacterium]|nr:AI-2E family transporter [Bryobacteraceae bacterium]
MAQEGWFSRERLLTLALILAFLLALYLCWLIISPFLTAIAWALALAIVGHPVHSWLSRHINSRGLSAGLSVAIVAIVLIVPAVLVAQAIISEAVEGIGRLQKDSGAGFWESLQGNPYLGRAVRWVMANANIGQEIQRAVQAIARRAPSVALGSLWAFVQLMITLYTLFFFFRDRRATLAWVRRLLPLSESDTNEVFRRVEDTIYGTIYGYLVVAMIQGTMGGLIFWFLGLPSPLLWGAVMVVMAAVPVLGAPVIWVPTAIFLAAQGEWKSALILTGWGATAMGLIDNILYPTLVGKRLRLHTLPVFFAVVGGVSVWGVAGVILGPMSLAVTLAMIEIWRRRTAHGLSAEESIQPGAQQVVEPAGLVKPGA